MFVSMSTGSDKLLRYYLLPIFNLFQQVEETTHKDIHTQPLEALVNAATNHVTELTARIRFVIREPVKTDQILFTSVATGKGFG